MKVFITKFSLTTGIIEIEARRNDFKDGNIIQSKNYSVIGTIPGGWEMGYYGNDFHLTLEEAKADQQRRAKRKIDSLKKQIAKIEKLLVA